MTIRSAIEDAADAAHKRASAEAEPALACAICGSLSCSAKYLGCRELLYWLPGRFDVVRCSNCGTLRTKPRPRPTEMEVYYPSFYASYAPTEERSPSWHREALKAVLGAPYRLRYGDQDTTPAAAPDRHRLLDIGSGAGAYAGRMAAAGWEVSIVEPNRQLAAATKVKLGLPEGRVCDVSAEEASFPEASFDLVTMSHVVEHLIDPIAVLQKVRTWLRPGGELRVWVPNAASWEAKVFRRSWHGLDVPRHVSHFEPSTLRRLLVTCGFSVERLVPDLQTGSLASSVLHLARSAGARLGRRSPYRRSSFVYYFTLVPGSLLVALGNAAYMDVTATRR